MSSRSGPARQTYDESRAGPLREAVDRVVLSWDGVDRTTTFGCPAYQVDGEQFAVVTNRGLVLTHLPSAVRTDLERRYGVASLRADPETADWVATPVGSEDFHGLLSYLRRSYRHALSM